MIFVISLPEKVKTAIAGAESKKRKITLKRMEDKFKLLFRENSYNIYSDIINYAFFDNFLNSFVVVDNNGKEFSYFINEEILDDIDIVIKFENDLFDGQVDIKERDNYIQRADKLRADVLMDMEKYLSDDFWKEFYKEGR